jgi:5'-3' exonuclease
MGDNMKDFLNKDTIVIDADILLFKFTIRYEYIVDKKNPLKKVGYVKDYKEGEHTIISDKERTLSDFDWFDKNIRNKTGMNIIYAFSSKKNFRYNEYPDYKSNRKGYIKPINYESLREHIINTQESIEMDWLEADDVIGILCTKNKNMVPCSKDKDLKQISGIHYNFETNEFFEVFKEDAERFFYYQILAGDSVDGYGGVPGLGQVKANRTLDIIYKLYKESNKEKTFSKFFWEYMVEDIKKLMLPEEYLLSQARCAKILDCNYYDFNKWNICQIMFMN